MLAEESDERNKRESYRLDDTATIRVRMLDENAVEKIGEDFNAFRLRYCTKSHLQNQKEVRKPKLIRIRKTNADIAEYLESLEVQISQLAERLDQVSESTEEGFEFTGRVNLSATGIRFRTDIPIKQGDTLEMGMELSTSNTQVVMLGQVLRVEERRDGKCAISVHYSHIHPEDTEAIIRHLAKLQQFELQARRGPGG